MRSFKEEPPCRKGILEWIGPVDCFEADRASDGVLYIGMRHFVARLIPDGQSFRVELLVPTGLPLFDPDPADDAS